MTRINVVEPAALTDQHLLAELRELPRVFALARPLAPREVVPRYTLGAGHVRFFYGRTGWLHRRQEALIAEGLGRGFALTYRTAPAPVPGLDDDWTPTADDVAVNVERLRERLLGAPRVGFYTYGGIVVEPTFYG